MLIHTRSALLQVLGTQFDVKTSLTSTVLNVSEGKVRVKRHSDGQEVDVPAKHRVIAGDEGEMTPQRVSDSINRWKTQLEFGPLKAWGNYGKWSPATDERPAVMKAIPFVPRKNQKVTLYICWDYLLFKLTARPSLSNRIRVLLYVAGLRSTPTSILESEWLI